jgi:hypothetical protein
LEPHSIFDRQFQRLCLVREKESVVDFTDTETYPDGQLIYFYDIDQDVIKSVNRSTNTFDLERTYKAVLEEEILNFNTFTMLV